MSFLRTWYIESLLLFFATDLQLSISPDDFRGEQAINLERPWLVKCIIDILNNFIFYITKYIVDSSFGMAEIFLFEMIPYSSTCTDCMMFLYIHVF